LLFLFRVFSVFFVAGRGYPGGRNHRIHGNHGTKAEQE
jgi:hypothetical protein